MRSSCQELSLSEIRLFITDFVPRALIRYLVQNHSLYLHQCLVIFHLLFIVIQQTRDVFLFLGNLKKSLINMFTLRYHLLIFQL